jgi:hypothetical protein
MQITTQKYTTLQISENFQAEKAHIHKTHKMEWGLHSDSDR